MPRTPTIRDVAARAQCSIATISRAMNQPERVERETLARVHDAIASVGYRPSAAGRALRMQRSHVVGVVVPSLANPVFAETVQGIHEAAEAAGYRLMLMSTGYDADRERAAIDTLSERRTDGLILTVGDALDNAALDALDLNGMPYVLAHNDAADARGRRTVGVDNFAAARAGVRLLIDAGHRHIRMVAGALASSDRARQRHAGYLAALGDAGLPALPLLETSFDRPALDAATLRLPVNEVSPSALFCSNDWLALAVIDTLRGAGIAVPRDMSVLGFDGLALGERIDPRLSSVCVPNRAIGARAWQGLQARLHDGDDGEAVRCRLPFELRAGASVAAPAARRNFSTDLS